MGFFAYIIIFILASISLYVWMYLIEKKIKHLIIKEESIYSTAYVRGTIRGYIGKLETNSMLEKRRKILKNRNSKF